MSTAMEEEVLRPEAPTRTWKRNERLVYLGNFLHMTMYTMCLGGIFDIYLYNLSQDQLILSSGPIAVGPGRPLPPALRVDTYSNFELTLSVKPSRDVVSYPSNSTCRRTYTCASSILHITDGSGNGDCCKVGNRMPALFFKNGTTQLHIMMDSDAQDESMDPRKYDKLQRCFSQNELPVDEWSQIKVKASGPEASKGQLTGNDPEGGLMLFVNGVKACEVPGTRGRRLPSVAGAVAFLGSLHGPLSDPHIPANVEIKEVKYGRPASNFFVGIVNSIQGILSVVLMYPIGWAGDAMNRYTLLRQVVPVGIVASLLISAGIIYSNLPFLFGGIIVFTLYQQAISSTIYAILADNVTGERRTKAGVNYKTCSALAMSFGPAIQGFSILAGLGENSWTKGTFDKMLLPGWVLLPGIGLAIFSIRSVGKDISSIPNVDEVQSPAVTERSTTRLNQTWLNDIVCLSLSRRFIVAVSVNAFFIGTLLANGMTVRYFSLYFTQILKFTPFSLCMLNTFCRLWIACFAQIGAPLARRLGRANLAIIFHLGSALFTLGIYGGAFGQPSVFVACFCYMMRFACLHARDPLLYSMTMDCAPPHQRSRWAALNSLRTLSFSASAVLGGYLADVHGYRFSFDITVVSLLLCTALIIPAWVWFPRSEGVRSVETFIVPPSSPG